MFRNPRWMALISGIAGVGILLVGALDLSAGDTSAITISYVVIGAVLVCACWGFYLQAIKGAPVEKPKKEKEKK